MKRLIVLAGLVLVGCGKPPMTFGGNAGASPTPVASGNPSPPAAGGFTLTSTAFQDGQPIPPGDTPPPIQWSGAPAGTACFAFEMIDPDAYNFVHWAVTNISRDATTVTGGAQGQNGSGANGYYHPEPPPGPPHHYVLTVYALDQEIQVGDGFKVEDLNKYMEGHILGQAKLTGTFQVNQ